jgi:catechol 2,3-dioxygenase-like lactoylglutathione lyase family enzyme
MNPASLSYIAPVFRVTDLARALTFYRDRLGFLLLSQKRRQFDSRPGAAHTWAGSRPRR